MNETIKAILDRRSIRNFKNIPLTDEQIQTFAQVALASPTGMDRQLWIFRLVTRLDLIQAMSDHAMNVFREAGDLVTVDRMRSRHKSIFYGAPLLILIGLPKDASSNLEAGIAVENLAIAAQSMGLASCIIGMASAAFTGDRGDELKDMLDWPGTHDFAISIAIGYPNTTKEAPERHPEKLKRII